MGDIGSDILLEKLRQKNDRLRKKLRELNSLYRASRLMVSMQDLNQLLNGIVRLAAGVLQARTASLMLLDEDRNELRIVAAKGLDEKTVRDVRMKIGESISGYVVEYGEPLLVRDVEKDKRFLRINRERYETKSLISVPLETKGKILGVLNLNNKRSGASFTAADLRLLTSFAVQAAVMVDNVRLLEENRHKVQELSILYEIARNVGTMDGLNRAVENIFNGVCEIASVDHCYWFLWEEKYQRLSLAYALAGDRTIDRWTKGQEIYVSEEQLHSLMSDERTRINKTVRDALVQWQLCDPQVRCFDCFPILVRGKLHGLFCIGSAAIENISEDKMRLISIVISQAASLYEQHATLSSATQVMTMSKVASEIAHDLRHPLTNIKGVLQVLETKWYNTDFRKESLQLIQQEIYRLTDLTKELVRFSDPSRFQISYRDIHHILDRALDLVRHDLERNGVRLKRQYGDNIPMIFVDENEMLETFLNIVQNSIESMNQGGELTVGTGLGPLRDESGQRKQFLKIDFNDTGTGIQEQHRDRVFERYFTTKEDGTGLGLSIARRIVTAHRGFIEVHSVPEKGSTFSVHLPV